MYWPTRKETDHDLPIRHTELPSTSLVSWLGIFSSKETKTLLRDGTHSRHISQPRGNASISTPALQITKLTPLTVMRLGKPIEHLQAALRASQTTGDVGEQITSIGKQLAYFGYLAYDAAVWVRIESWPPNRLLISAG
jgi:hypothetical protein